MQASIMAITGMQFTSENFVRLWEHSLPQPQRTSQILQTSVGPEVPAQITAADAETSANAGASHALPWSARQIVAFEAVGALSGQHPRGTWRISRSA